MCSKLFDTLNVWDIVTNLYSSLLHATYIIRKHLVFIQKQG
ncbi:hypothetical protein SPHINGO8BC_90439 [Sphingobacterium multivorum]|uniref:Uncharacterized protein n=1 Tax=Sphingobacterium multivorum TaxID=28454 RepID=A0A654DSX8_SPHMU|nr:hypothetical protein SPHINGO8BC_90439 [Sphingobacterium multivorum]